MEVFMLIDDVHSNSVFEDLIGEDDPGIETFRSLEQAKAYAQTMVDRDLMTAGQPPLPIEWSDSEKCSAPLNLPEQIGYFQILRGIARDPGMTEQYWQQRGR